MEWLRSAVRLQSVPPDLAVSMLRERAAIETGLGRFRDAEEHLRGALGLARSLDQPETIARLEIRRAYVLIKLLRPDEAEQCLEAADKYSRAHPEASFDPYILNYRGLALIATNQFESAIPLLEASRQAFRANKKDGLAAEVIINLAWSYFRLGQIDKAIALDQEALKIAEPKDLHLIWGNLGNMLLDQLDYQKAAEYSKNAAELAKGRSPALQVKWLNNLTLALVHEDKWEEAERYNGQVLDLVKQIEDSEARSMALVNRGYIETKKGAYQAAEQDFKKVTESKVKMNLHALSAYSGLAGLYNHTGRPDDSRREFELGLAAADKELASLQEDENKISYLSSLIDIHQQYVDFLMDCKDEAGAFAAAESSRARLLRERLDLQHSEAESYSIAKYQAAAQAFGGTFLAYWIGPERSYLWTISGKHFVSYQLPKEPEIRRLVEQYQGAIERGSALQPEDTAAGAKLFKLLLPAGVRKPGGRYLIVPDGPLYALNFETLPVPGDRPHYWIEDATVAVAPSLDLLLERRVPAKSGRSVLLVGDASEWNPEYPKLLNARQEMDGIETVFPAVQRKVLAGPVATAAAYESANPGNYSYIHFTAHATANKNSPFDSAIILSRENGGTGGRLAVKEVLANRLHAELVTISACHSAGARTYWGEGLVGFAWAFLQSGAHGVIAGLWDVSDYSSPRLMHDLYAGLAASRIPEDALRTAKLALIHGGRYTEPYYWGAFQLYKGTL